MITEPFTVIENNRTAPANTQSTMRSAKLSTAESNSLKQPRTPFCGRATSERELPAYLAAHPFTNAKPKLT